MLEKQRTLTDKFPFMSQNKLENNHGLALKQELKRRGWVLNGGSRAKPFETSIQTQESRTSTQRPRFNTRTCQNKITPCMCRRPPSPRNDASSLRSLLLLLLHHTDVQPSHLSRIKLPPKMLFADLPDSSPRAPRPRYAEAVREEEDRVGYKCQVTSVLLEEELQRVHTPR